jgi:lysophospholipase L1-like esterase
MDDIKGVNESAVKQAEPVIYVALGDSTGVGVGARKGGGYVARIFHRIERARPRSRLVNLCMSGATTADVLRAQVNRLTDARPTLVTLGIGINDVSRNHAPEQFARNYEEIILKIKERTSAPIVVTNIPDISFAPVVPAFMRDEARRRINVYNDHIARLAAKHKLFLVDAYEKSHKVIPTHPEYFSDDNFHPSDEGYEFWAAMMWQTVKEAIGEE